MSATATVDTLAGFACEVGAARSGTNFLGELLSAHPMLAYWRRPKYIWRHGNAWQPDDCLTAERATPRIRRFIRRRFAEYLQVSGRPRLLVCTQANVLALDFVNAVFPEGKILHIIRDGREVAASQKREWELHSTIGGGERIPLFQLLAMRVKEVPPTDLPAYFGEFAGTMWNWLSGNRYRYSMGPKIKDWRRLTGEMDRLAFCALTWRECVSAARRVGQTMPADRYHEVRFEELMSRPEETVARLLEFLDLPPAQSIDEFVAKKLKRETSGKWLSRLDQEELDTVMPYVGELCQELGYV